MQVLDDCTATQIIIRWLDIFVLSAYCAFKLFIMIHNAQFRENACL